MQVVTGKSVLNGIAIGKIKVYTPPKVVISDELVEDTGKELECRQQDIPEYPHPRKAVYDLFLIHCDSSEDRLYNTAVRCQARFAFLPVPML